MLDGNGGQTAKLIRCAIYTRKSTDEGLTRPSTASMPSAKHVKPI